MVGVPHPPPPRLWGVKKKGSPFGTSQCPKLKKKKNSKKSNLLSVKFSVLCVKMASAHPSLSRFHVITLSRKIPKDPPKNKKFLWILFLLSCFFDKSPARAVFFDKKAPGVWLGIMNYELWIEKFFERLAREPAHYELWTERSELGLSQLWIMNYELWIKNYELWIKNYK